VYDSILNIYVIDNTTGMCYLKIIATDFMFMGMEFHFHCLYIQQNVQKNNHSMIQSLLFLQVLHNECNTMKYEGKSTGFIELTLSGADCMFNPIYCCMLSAANTKPA
jgi:hypothetical protein